MLRKDPALHSILEKNQNKDYCENDFYKYMFHVRSLQHNNNKKYLAAPGTHGYNVAPSITNPLFMSRNEAILHDLTVGNYTERTKQANFNYNVLEEYQPHEAKQTVTTAMAKLMEYFPGMQEKAKKKSEDEEMIEGLLKANKSKEVLENEEMMNGKNTEQANVQQAFTLALELATSKFNEDFPDVVQLGYNAGEFVNGKWTGQELLRYVTGESKLLYEKNPTFKLKIRATGNVKPDNTNGINIYPVVPLQPLENNNDGVDRERLAAEKRYMKKINRSMYKNSKKIGENLRHLRTTPWDDPDNDEKYPSSDSEGGSSSDDDYDDYDDGGSDVEHPVGQSTARENLDLSTGSNYIEHLPRISGRQSNLNQHRDPARSNERDRQRGLANLYESALHGQHIDDWMNQTVADPAAASSSVSSNLPPIEELEDAPVVPAVREKPFIQRPEAEAYVPSGWPASKKRRQPVNLNQELLEEEMFDNGVAQEQAAQAYAEGAAQRELELRRLLGEYEQQMHNMQVALEAMQDQSRADQADLANARLRGGLERQGREELQRELSAQAVELNRQFEEQMQGVRAYYDHQIGAYQGEYHNLLQRYEQIQQQVGVIPQIEAALEARREENAAALEQVQEMVEENERREAEIRAQFAGEIHNERNQRNRLQEENYELAQRERFLQARIGSYEVLLEESNQVIANLREQQNALGPNQQEEKQEIEEALQEEIAMRMQLQREYDRVLGKRDIEQPGLDDDEKNPKRDRPNNYQQPGQPAEEEPDPGMGPPLPEDMPHDMPDMDANEDLPEFAPEIDYAQAERIRAEQQRQEIAAQLLAERNAALEQQKRNPIPPPVPPVVPPAPKPKPTEIAPDEEAKRPPAPQIPPTVISPAEEAKRPEPEEAKRPEPEEAKRPEPVPYIPPPSAEEIHKRNAIQTAEDWLREINQQPIPKDEIEDMVDKRMRVFIKKRLAESNEEARNKKVKGRQFKPFAQDVRNYLATHPWGADNKDYTAKMTEKYGGKKITGAGLSVSDDYQPLGSKFLHLPSLREGKLCITNARGQHDAALAQPISKKLANVLLSKAKGKAITDKSLCARDKTLLQMISQHVSGGSVVPMETDETRKANRVDLLQSMRQEGNDSRGVQSELRQMK
jgi:hypothetical protein